MATRRSWCVLSLLVAPALAQQPVLAEVHRLLPVAEPVAEARSAVADIDGDGRLDLVTVHQWRTVVWRATPDGRFEHLPGSLVHPWRCIALVLADVDGDGDPDCVTVAEDNTWMLPVVFVVLFRNDGTGMFGTSSGISTGWWNDTPTSLASGDADGDGDVDLLVGVVPVGTPFPGAGSERLLVNDGTGSFTASLLPAAADPTKVVVLADFDGDGDLDVFAGNDAQTPDRLYTNNGAGVFAHAPSALPMDARSALAVHVIDAEPDNDLDLLVHDVEGIRLLVNNGNASFMHVAAATPPVSGTSSFVGDFDRDGRVDYAVHAAPYLHVVANIGGSFVHPPASAMDVGDGFLAAADFESDGDFDFLATRLLALGTYSDARVYRNHGPGTFTKVAADLPPGLAGTMALAVADIDGDGDQDVIGTTGVGWVPPARRVFRNDGNAGFTSVAAGDFTLDTARVDALATGDVDGDNDVDVMTSGNGSGGTSTLYLNNGAAFTRVAFPALPAISVALGDLDGDGDLDAFLLTQSQSQVALNQGGGVFTLSAAMLPAFQGSRVALADVDGDADLDAVIAASPDRLMLNDGSGAFAESIGALGTGWGNAVSVFDCDGDLDLDIVFNGVGWSNGPNRLLRNNGNGTFVPDANAMPASTAGVFQGTNLDVDGDGDQDFLGIALDNRGGTQLFINDGNGIFSLLPNGIAPARGTAWFAAAADLDGDGDVDALLGDIGEPHLHQNMQHQVTWATLPRVGYTLSLDLRGRANEPYILGAALVSTALPIPGVGTLRLDPGTLRVMALGAYDTAGRAAFQAPVPNAPVLIGISVYWQALNAAPLALGNLEVTTLLAH